MNTEKIATAIEEISHAMQIVRQKWTEIEQELKFGDMQIDQLDLEDKIKDRLKGFGLTTVSVLNEKAHCQIIGGLSKYRGLGEVKIVKIMVALHKLGLRVDDCVMSPSMRSKFEEAISAIKN